MGEQASPLIKWHTADRSDFIITVCLLLLIIIFFCIYKYYKTKERTRIKNQNLFLRQIKQKDLNDNQLKLIKKMVSYLQLKNPMDIISNVNLFESNLTDFIKYLEDEAENNVGIEVNFEEIFRDLIIILDKLFGSKQLKIKIALESMSKIEIGEIVYLKTEYDDIILGKIAAKREDHLGLKLFIPQADLKFFEDETKISIHLIKPDDGEYLIHTVTMGTESHMLLVKISDNFSKIMEFSHPYIDVMIPAHIAIYSQVGKVDSVECVIFKINEDECVLRMDTGFDYEREYRISFVLDDFMYNVFSRIISIKAIEKERVYYSTFRFMDMTEFGKKNLIKYISESDNIMS